MEFRDWFCLKDRDSFTIDPKIYPDDARFYFGRKELESRIKAQLRRSFIAPGTPKMIILGPYGSGKTQTLYNLEYYLFHEKPASCKFNPKTVHLDLEMQSKSDYSSWHLQLLEALGKDAVTEWVNQLFGKVSDLDAELRLIFGDPNMVEAIRTLRVGGDMGLTAWRWLSGQSLSTKELEQLRVTRNLGQVGAGDMVNALIGIGKLAEANGEKIIFLIDEAEQFRNVRVGDATESLHQYLRKLSEPANSSVGFIIGCFAVTIDDMPELMARPDVRGRIGENNYVEIPPLPSVPDIQIFLKELLTELINQTGAEAKIQAEGLGVTLETYPFTSDAFDILCEYASQDPVKALPRNLIKALNECSIAAWDDGKGVVDESIVNEWAPLIFG